MKRFVRLTNGKIIDFQEKYKDLISLNAICKTKQEFNKRQKQHFRSIYYSEQWKTLYVFDYGGFYMLDILEQADTIEELIMVGDLVKFSCEKIGIKNEIAEVKANDLFISEYQGICVRGVLAIQNAITELYTKQGRNYILVAEKVNGEWRVL